MARRNATDNTPASLLNALDYIEENTGLLGDANPGNAHLSAGGTTLMLTSDRPSFDHHSLVLDYINDPDNHLKITYVGHRSGHGGIRGYIEVQSTK